jgi:hypothetical protein
VDRGRIRRRSGWRRDRFAAHDRLSFLHARLRLRDQRDSGHSTNLVDWSTPIQFFTSPVPEFTQDQSTDENVILVTPGSPDQVIGQTGYVLYAHTPAWGRISHELWVRPFTFQKNP